MSSSLANCRSTTLIRPTGEDCKFGEMLNKALAAIEDENDSLHGVLKSNIDFNAGKGKDGKTRITDQKWKATTSYRKCEVNY